MHEKKKIEKKKIKVYTGKIEISEAYVTSPYM